MADNKSQREYNDLLKITQSMMGDISKSMDDVAKKSDKRNKALEYEASFTADLLKNLESQADLEKLLLDIKKQKNDISKQDFGTNTELGNQYKIQLSAAQEIVSQRIKDKQILDKVSETVNEYGSDFKSKIDGVFDTIKGIPIIGRVLGKLFDPLQKTAGRIVDGLGRQFMGGFSKSFSIARGEGLNTFKSFRAGLSGGIKSAMKFGKAAARLLGPIGVAILAIGAALAIGFKRFQEIEKAAENFRRETGLLNSQTRDLKTNIQQVSSQMAGLGASAADVSKAAADFTNEFGGLEQPSKEVLGSMVALNKNFGIGTQEAAKLNKVFQNIGGLNATQSQALIGQTAEMAKMAGVAPQQVIKDMAENSEVAYQFFGGSAEELAKSAVKAAALGTSIAEAGKAARGLLDYQSSVTKELEASAILGTNINLSQARYLAANGDVLGSQQAVLDSVSQLGDLTKLNVYEQEALAEATGMEFSSLVNQQRIRERFGKLKGEELEAANALVTAGKDLSKISKADLNAQTRRLALQKGMQSETSRFGDAMSSIGTAFMDMFAPIVDFLMPILADIGEVLNNVISPIFRVIGSIVGALLVPFGFLFDIIGAIIKPLSKMVGIIIDGIATPFNEFIEMFNGFGSIIEDIGKFFNDYVIQPLTRAYEIGKSMASVLTFGIAGGGGFSLGDDNGGSTVTSVNDAVISPGGDVISTNPNDYLIATQNPQGLGGGVNMGGVISELKELKQAFLSNKDVFLDNRKVTAAVTITQERSSKNAFGMNNA